MLLGIKHSITFKIEPLNCHENSATHTTITEKNRVQNATPGKSVAEKSLSKTFVMHMYLKNMDDSTSTAATWICNFDHAKGIDVGKTYQNYIIVATFIHKRTYPPKKKL